MKKSASTLFQTEEPSGFDENSLNIPEDTTNEELNEGLPEENDIPDVNNAPEEETKSEEKTKPVDTSYNPDNVVDVELTAIKKQRFRFNGDDSKILELNTRDLGISNRLSIAYENLNKMMDEVADTLGDMPGIDEDSEEEIEITETQENKIVKALKRLDDSMRKELDFLFDAPVAMTTALVSNVAFFVISSFVSPLSIIEVTLPLANSTSSFSQ